MIRLTVLMIFMLLNSALPAQTTRIEFNSPHQPLSDELKGVMPLYKYQSDTVFYYGKSYTLQLPNNVTFQDTAFAFTYFTGWKNAPIPRTTLFVIGNYQSENPVIYVDYNHNLDLSDDGAPLTFTEEKPFTIIRLKNSEIQEGVYPLRISPVVYKDEAMKDRTVEFHSNNH